ncbi:type IV secretion system DNA-binding domain-containing protein [uncultured Litoreibacter sp.]|uniref:type IV secretory system conjugative DNA transfer family protein n=1 Tax=uncultured Litoreibacter sp. TaxID=1392394 RepID=UPI00262978DC|nr:type IV secretion system DNA-binding domain-containing protein [uncultured Litoreibacter sp.]
MRAPFPIIGLIRRRNQPPATFGVPQGDRLMHMLCVGQTGTGKSTLIENLAFQDAHSGSGYCLIDPHGDLVESLHLKLERPHKYWMVADPNCGLGYNPLKRVNAAHRPLVASALIETLKKQWPDAWGARMEHLLRYATLALLEFTQADLRDLMKLFVFKGFRRQVVEQITDPQVLFFWKHEFPAMNYQNSADGVSPIANKLGAFLAHPAVREALCDPKTPLSFRAIMDNSEILLVNLAKGRLGTDVSNVLGGLITSSIMHAAFTRHNQPAASRRPFFLYVDEFHNLTTKSFAGLLAEARKYGLGLILAHQHLSQIDTEVRDAIIGNVGTTVVFRVGATDGPFFERLLPPFTASDLQNQPNYRAAIRMMQNGARLKPFTADMQPPYHEEA